MKYIAVLTVISAASLSSCATTETPASPGETPLASSGNPLIGTWKFDSAASTVHSVAAAANSGALGTSQDRTKQLLKLSEGSTVTFTSHTITMTIADGRSTSMEYSIKSQDANGNLVIVNPEGLESPYSVSGNKLISPMPDMNFVGVYVR